MRDKAAQDECLPRAFSPERFGASVQHREFIKRFWHTVSDGTQQKCDRSPNAAVSAEHLFFPRRYSRPHAKPKQSFPHRIFPNGASVVKYPLREKMVSHRYKRPRHAAQHCSLLLFRRTRLFAFPLFPFQKSWRLSLKTSLFLSKSPQLSRKSADVFLFSPRRSFSRRQFRGQTPSLSSENRAPQQVGWESGNVCLAVRHRIRKFAAN